MFLFIFISCASTSVVNDDNLWIDLGSVSYGDDPNQFIEITIPKNTIQNANVIFYIHGYGNKMVDLTFLEYYRDDFIIGKLDYRYVTSKRPELNMNELLKDVHNGLDALKTAVEPAGVRVNKVIMMGNSLGSTLALMYSFLSFNDLPVPIAFCVSMAAVTDLTDEMYARLLSRPGNFLIRNQLLSLFSALTGENITSGDISSSGFSGRVLEAGRKISAIFYVNNSAPPVILIHDKNDNIVPFSNSLSLYNVLRSHNIPSIFIQSDLNAGHELGKNIINRNHVFAPSNARPPFKTPARQTRKINPQLEEKLLEAINQYIADYLD